MATTAGQGPSTSGFSANQLSDIIECPICYTVYNKPLQLSCGHTLCATCIDRLVEGARGPNGAGNGPGNLAAAVVAAINVAGGGGGPQPPPMIPNPNQGVRMGDFLGAAADFMNMNEMGPGLGGIPPNDPMFQNGGPGPIRGLMPFPPRNAVLGQMVMHRNGYRHNRRAAGTEIKCPECRKPTVVPPEGLPVNYRVQDIVAKMATNSVKTEPLLKPRCKVCDELLVQGVYFDCIQCGDDGMKLCSTCAIRTHNGHNIQERRAITDADVQAMKDKISAHAGVAFQAIDQLQPKLTECSTIINEKVFKILQDSISYFESLATSFDNRIDASSTIDELDAEIDKAAKLGVVYEEAVKRVEEQLVAKLNDIVTDYMAPLRKMMVELGLPPKERRIEPRENVENGLEQQQQQQQQQQQDNNDQRAQNDFMQVLRDVREAVREVVQPMELDNEPNVGAGDAPGNDVVDPQGPQANNDEQDHVLPRNNGEEVGNAVHFMMMRDRNRQRRANMEMQQMQQGMAGPQGGHPPQQYPPIPPHMRAGPAHMHQGPNQPQPPQMHPGGHYQHYQQAQPPMWNEYHPRQQPGGGAVNYGGPAPRGPFMGQGRMAQNQMIQPLGPRYPMGQVGNGGQQQQQQIQAAPQQQQQQQGGNVGPQQQQQQQQAPQQQPNAGQQIVMNLPQPPLNGDRQQRQQGIPVAAAYNGNWNPNMNIPGEIVVEMRMRPAYAQQQQQQQQQALPGQPGQLAIQQGPNQQQMMHAQQQLAQAQAQAHAAHLMQGAWHNQGNAPQGGGGPAPRRNPNPEHRGPPRNLNQLPQAQQIDYQRQHLQHIHQQLHQQQQLQRARMVERQQNAQNMAVQNQNQVQQGGREDAEQPRRAPQEQQNDDPNRQRRQEDPLQLWQLERVARAQRNRREIIENHLRELRRIAQLPLPPPPGVGVDNDAIGEMVPVVNHPGEEFIDVGQQDEEEDQNGIDGRVENAYLVEDVVEEEGGVQPVVGVIADEAVNMRMMEDRVEIIQENAAPDDEDQDHDFVEIIEPEEQPQQELQDVEVVEHFRTPRGTPDLQEQDQNPEQDQEQEQDAPEFVAQGVNVEAGAPENDDDEPPPLESNETPTPRRIMARRNTGRFGAENSRRADAAVEKTKKLMEKVTISPAKHDSGVHLQAGEGSSGTSGAPRTRTNSNSQGIQNGGHAGPVVAKRPRRAVLEEDVAEMRGEDAERDAEVVTDETVDHQTVKKARIRRPTSNAPSRSNSTASSGLITRRNGGRATSPSTSSTSSGARTRAARGAHNHREASP